MEARFLTNLNRNNMPTTNQKNLLRILIYNRYCTIIKASITLTKTQKDKHC